MTGLATACVEVPNLVRVEVLENKSLSRTIISFDTKSDLCVGSVRLVHFEADERASEFLFEALGGGGCCGGVVRFATVALQ